MKCRNTRRPKSSASYEFVPGKQVTLAHLIVSYRNKPDITWSTLSSCYAEEGQLDFEVMYGDSGFCGSEFYLDTARSTDNDYYFEGAFAISSDYRQGEPLRLEALEPGKTTVRADGDRKSVV